MDNNGSNYYLLGGSRWEKLINFTQQVCDDLFGLRAIS